jgi:hypothetical protein
MQLIYALILAALIWLAAHLFPARAETPWLPPRCCDLSSDCLRLPDNTVSQDRDGYAFVHAGRLYRVPFARTLDSQDGHFYACFPFGRLACFAAPKGGY